LTVLEYNGGNYSKGFASNCRRWMTNPFGG